MIGIWKAVIAGLTRNLVEITVFQMGLRVKPAMTPK
jgi:hypothetical protein